MGNIDIIDLGKTIKRLELIKSLVALEEEEEIENHILKIEQGILEQSIIEIINLLRQKSYSNAINLIEVFIQKNKSLQTFIDPEISALRLEIKTLETKINFLSEEKTDLEKLIHDFSITHSKILGHLILKILEFRKAKAKGTKREFEAEEDYNNYSEEFETTKKEKLLTLSEEDKKEIKDKYRKASKLSHPDVVSDTQKEMATKLFAELNEAYASNDLKKVSEILENLEKGNFFVSKSDTINEKQLILTEIENLKNKINELSKNIQEIKESETYNTISKIENWDEYFSTTKHQLEEQLKEFENK